MKRGDKAALVDPLTLACHLDPQVVRRPHLEVISSTVARLTPQGGDRVMIICPPQVGKPCDNDTVVLMGDGSRRRLGDVRVGDDVITHRGKPRRVLAVHEQGLLPTLRITTGTGRTTVANHDHPFLTRHGWVQAADLTVGDVLVSVAAPDHEPAGTLDARGARLLGYLVADPTSPDTGHEETAFRTTLGGDAVARDFRDCCDALGLSADRPAGASSARSGFPAVPGAMLPWLRSHGLTDTDGLARVPHAVFTAAPEVIAHFVGAYLDRHGTVDHDEPGPHDSGGTGVEFGPAARGLLDDVQHLLLRLGIRSTLHAANGTPADGQPGVWRLRVSRPEDLARLRDTVPTVDEEKTRRLSRLPTPPGEPHTGYAPNEIVSIDDAGLRECRCLTVEQDHTFTADDLVVHNSYMACWGVFWWLIHNPDHRVIVGSYGTTLAGIRGRTIRRLVEQYGPRYGVDLLKGAKSVTNWSLTSGGGVLSAGVAAGITGNPADCVAAGTPVRVPGGEATVELIATGRVDRVLSYNHATGAVEPRAVLATRRIPGRPTVLLRTAHGREIRCTPDHLVHTADHGYIPAADLRPGQPLLAAAPSEPRSDWPPRAVRDTVLHVRATATTEDVYDIQVQGNGNFFAGGLLVHNCFLIDDPIRSRADAESRIIREQVWDWWSGDANSRLAPGAPVLLVQTRWHPDDLAGRLMAEEGTVHEGGRWQVVYLPAFAVPANPDRGIPPDSLGRSPGQPLSHPKIALHDTARLVRHWEDKRRSAAARDWAALWQGDPRPVEDALVSRSLLRERHDFTPKATPIKHVVAVDPAGGGKDNIGIVAGFLGDDLRLYVTHDRSVPGGKGSDRWPDVVVRLAHEIDADRLVYETNYGKNLVKMAITTAWEAAQRNGAIPSDALMPQLVPVSAKKNKRLRAEPVAQLLVVDKIRFAGSFVDLEGQWATWVPTEPDSPGNLDAMVYLAYNLLKPRRRRAPGSGTGLNPGSVSRTAMSGGAGGVLSVPAPRGPAGGPDRFGLRRGAGPGWGPWR